jgi:hypothetical protein
MKEDVLEQIVEDYLQVQGYFTRHNVRFKPRTDHPDFVSRDDSVSSDVDIVGYHPQLEGNARVMVVSCKAWQAGFDATAKLAELNETKANPKRETWRHFRELWKPKWAEAFRAAVAELTGATTFSYRIAVTNLRGNEAAWGSDATIASNLPGCDVGFLTLESMWAAVLADITTTPASSEIGRLAQLLKAAGLTAPQIVTPPSGPAPDSDAAAADHRLEAISDDAP